MPAVKIKSEQTGVDIFEKEAPFQAKNCLVTPHVAFATNESMSLRAEIVFDNLAAWLEGAPKNLVK